MCICIVSHLVITASGRCALQYCALLLIILVCMSLAAQPTGPELLDTLICCTQLAMFSDYYTLATTSWCKSKDCDHHVWDATG